MKHSIFVELVAAPDARIEMQFAGNLQAAAQTVLAGNTHAAHQVRDRWHQLRNGRRACCIQKCQLIVDRYFADLIAIPQAQGEG